MFPFSWCPEWDPTKWTLKSNSIQSMTLISVCICCNTLHRALITSLWLHGVQHIVGHSMVSWNNRILELSTFISMSVFRPSGDNCSPFVQCITFKVFFSPYTYLDKLNFRFSTAVTVKNTVMCDAPPCSPLKVHQDFAWLYCLHFTGWCVNQASWQQKWGGNRCIAAHYLPGLLFNLEDAVSIFLRNVNELLHSTALRFKL